MQEDWREAHEEYDRVFEIVRDATVSEEEKNRLIEDHSDWVFSSIRGCQGGEEWESYKIWRCRQEVGTEDRRDRTIARTEALKRCYYYRFGIVEGPPFCPSFSHKSDTQAASL